MEFILIASAHFLALLSPGPDFFLIMQAALRLPLRYGIAICAGIATANAIYLLVPILGLEAIRELEWLMLTLKYLGAMYLIFLGVMLLKTRRQSLASGKTSSFLHSHHMGRQFMLGCMSGLLNPKNMIFYLSLFTVMVSPQTDIFTRILYALWMTLVVFLWDCLLILMVSQSRVKEWIGHGVFYVEKISGILLTALGFCLPFS